MIFKLTRYVEISLTRTWTKVFPSKWGVSVSQKSTSWQRPGSTCNAAEVWTTWTIWVGSRCTRRCSRFTLVQSKFVLFLKCYRRIMGADDTQQNASVFENAYVPVVARAPWPPRDVIAIVSRCCLMWVKSSRWGSPSPSCPFNFERDCTLARAWEP